MKSNIFHWFYLFPYCSLLWVSDIEPKSLNLRNTHQKSNRQTLFLYSGKQNNWQKIIGQKFRLTPGYRNLLNRKFVTALEAEPQVDIRILNTVCSLGTTLLQSGTLIPELVKPR